MIESTNSDCVECFGRDNGRNESLPIRFSKVGYDFEEDLNRDKGRRRRKICRRHDERQKERKVNDVGNGFAKPTDEEGNQDGVD